MSNEVSEREALRAATERVRALPRFRVAYGMHHIDRDAVLAILAALSATPEPGLTTVYAVVFSNYSPSEIDSVWAKEEAAQAQATHLNEGADWDPWHVEKMEVKP